MTKREIIFTIFEKLKIQSDDSDITPELISSLIDSKRAMLLKQQYAKNAWFMPIEIKQELCFDLEVADSIQGISCFGTILRTKNALPRSIKLKGKEGPLLIRKYDRTDIHVNLVPIERLPYIGNNPAISRMLYTSLDYDGKLYFLSNNKAHLFLEAIKVTDIFEQPDIARELECKDNDSSIEVWDAEYPIEASMADVLINIIVQEVAKTMGLPEDNVNDAEDVRK